MQEINLYQPVSKGVRGMLSARSTSMVFGIIGATLVGLWAFAWWQVDKLRDAAQVVQNQQQAQAAMAAAQGPQLDGLSDEDLEALVAKLGDAVKAKTAAVSMLTGESRSGAYGFSPRLRAFGTRHIDGIWLDRLMLGPSNEYVSVSGTTLAPEFVPRYLRSLAQDPALKGGKMDEFVIEKPQRKTDDGRIVTIEGRLNFTAGHLELRKPTAPGEGTS